MSNPIGTPCHNFGPPAEVSMNFVARLRCTSELHEPELTFYVGSSVLIAEELNYRAEGISWVKGSVRFVLKLAPPSFSPLSHLECNTGLKVFLGSKVLWCALHSLPFKVFIATDQVNLGQAGLFWNPAT